VNVRWVTVGPFQENSYLLSDEASKRGVLIDPGDEAARITGMVQKAGVTIEAIWLTHGHLDHIGAVQAMRREFGAPVLLHPADQPLYQRAAQSAAMYGVPFEQPDDPDAELTSGGTLTIAGRSFTVVHTPGHAPGHVAFIGDGVMIGGDLLFAGSIGRTDLPLSDPAAMEESLARVAAMDPALVVYPGHGPPTTIGDELQSNPYLSQYHAA
jgi:glyoxylase-like metal-dependent hydrolase (beta-lactamase superfamily II)